MDMTTDSSGLKVRNASSDEDFAAVLDKICPYSTLSEERLYTLFRLAKSICEKNVLGNFVECGSAGGGSSALLAYVIRRYSRTPRKVFVFSFFCGFPQPTRDGPHGGLPAGLCGRGASACSTPESSVREACALLGIGEVPTTVKGYLDETLPNMHNWVGMIALLHLNADGYQSTSTILNTLWDRLSNDAILQVDRYGWREGCSKALHEFEAEQNVKFDINPIHDTAVWFCKPESFRINPRLSSTLVDDFKIVDPVEHGIETLMSTNERFQLFYAIRNLLPNTSQFLRFIEIGSYAGGTLFEICMSLRHQRRPYRGIALEPYPRRQFHDVMALFSHDVVHVPMYSNKALETLLALDEGRLPYDLILVDGDHTYDGVRQDIVDYYPLLSPGGVMVFHDYLPPLDDWNREFIYDHHAGTEPGVRQACHELMELKHGLTPVPLPLLFPDDPTQTQAHLPIIPNVFSTIRVYGKPLC
jgi:predicted O-methyltransferase YrrM